MTLEVTNSSRPFGPANLQEVYDLNESTQNLPPKVRQDVLSALNTLAELAGAPLRALPPEVLRIRAYLRKRVKRDGTRISAGRSRNIASLISIGLANAGVRIRRRGRRVPLPAPWQACADALPERPHRIDMVGFMRWAVERDLGPGDVTQEHVDSYGADLRANSLLVDPRRVYRATIRAMIWAAEHVPGWPVRAPALTPMFKDRYPVVTPPPSFTADVEAWATCVADPNPMSPYWRRRKAFRPMRPVTLRFQRGVIRRAFAALVEAGRAAGDIATLADLVKPANIEALINVQFRRGQSRTARNARNPRDGEEANLGGIHNTGIILLTIAAHYACLDDADVDKIRVMVTSLAPPNRNSMTPKNRDLLNLFKDDRLIGDLLGLRDKVFARFRKSDQLGHSQCVTLSLATAVEIQLVSALRMKNLASLNVRRHIKAVHSDGSVTVELPEAEMKTKRPHTFVLDAEVMRHISEYQRRALPALTVVDEGFLFPGEKGGSKSSAWLGLQIAAFTEAELGTRVTPHQFRHLAGMFWLMDHPGDYETVRQLLGHRHLKTTIEVYAGLTQLAASSIYGAHIAQLKRQLAWHGVTPMSRQTGTP